MAYDYQGKLVSAEEAVRAVRDGDWVDYGFARDSGQQLRSYAVTS